MRSNFMLGKYIFIKVVSLTRDQGIKLATSLIDNNKSPPFASNEFMFNYFITKTDKSRDQGINQTRLLTPGTLIYVSGSEYKLKDIEKYKEGRYEDTIKDLENNYMPMDEYLEQIREISKREKYVKTALIVNRRVTGNYDDFLKKYANSDNYDKIFTDSMIHISYLYHKLQKHHQAVHGDPKTQNYTWLELEKPVNIVYDFRDEYNSSNSRIVRRKNVKHIFYLTNMKFVFSPVKKSLTLKGEKFYFDFFITNAAWYGKEYNDPNDRIFVPKITSSEPYQLNFNLYGGYFNQYDKSSQHPDDFVLYNYYEIFPRMFSIDLLTLIKIFLTYWYADSLNGSNLRKLNIYFTQFVSLSLMEENPNRRDEGDYLRVSPGTLAQLLDSGISDQQLI